MNRSDYPRLAAQPEAKQEIPRAEWLRLAAACKGLQSDKMVEAQIVLGGLVTLRVANVRAVAALLRQRSARTKDLRVCVGPGIVTARWNGGRGGITIRNQERPRPDWLDHKPILDRRVKVWRLKCDRWNLSAKIPDRVFCFT